mgnify:CR=1 FL=1
MQETATQVTASLLFTDSMGVIAMARPGEKGLSAPVGRKKGARPLADPSMKTATTVPIADLDDTDLVERARRGETPCFDELVLRYRDKAMRLVLSTLGARGDVEDIVQDVFLKLYRSLDRFRGDASFSTWLYTATINRCRDEMRRKKVRRFFSFEDWFGRDAEAELGLVGTNGQRLEADERVRVVRLAMNRLAPDTRMLLHLREVEGISYRALAEVFGVEIGTIKSRLARARQKLRVELLPYMEEGLLPGERSR